MHLGTLVIGGNAEESDGLRVDLPAPVRAQVNRWDLLRERSDNGWVTLGNFTEVFKIKYTGNVKHAMARVKKKLVDAGLQVKKTEPPQGRGWPSPRAHVCVCDLKRVYNEFT